MVRTRPWDSLKRRKETDLIYEGIATIHQLPVRPKYPLKETDLIYEGIATAIS